MSIHQINFVIWVEVVGALPVDEASLAGVKHAGCGMQPCACTRLFKGCMEHSSRKLDKVYHTNNVNKIVLPQNETTPQQNEPKLTICISTAKNRFTSSVGS